MRFNRFLSLAALLSVAGSVLAAPIPKPFEVKAGSLEVEVERESGKIEAEVEHGPNEVEVEVTDPTQLNRRRLAARSHPTRSPVASVMDAQKQLDELTPQIEQAMQGPLGSIEKTVGVHLDSVDTVVHALEGNLASFVGDKPEVLYENADGTGQVTDAEFAKYFSTFFLTISDMEEMVKHVSGYAVTSAQLNIRNDLASMKKTLLTIAPGVRANVANTLATAMSMGTGASGLMLRE
ncbi:hypothetical protein RhiJN_16527 [Ceratobasidium sp. AG-Ba]|nr:hypothetical protein RhiJN_16527 [Ceratobasidium sp. AG-Ba]